MSSILHIIAAPAAGGAEIYVRDLACRLAAMGHTLHLAFLDRAVDLDCSAAFEKTFLSQLEAHGIGYSFIGHEARRKPWLGAKRLRSLVHAKRIDLIHSHLAFGNVFASAIPRTPLVYTHHTEKKRFSKAFWTYFRLRAARFIGISETCVDNLRRYVGPSAAVDLVLNGIDLSNVPARSADVSAGHSGLRAICVGRISQQKNYGLLASAIAALDSEQRERLIIDVFGEGDPGIVRACEEILERAGVSPTILHFRGATSQIRDILQEYDMFFMSSAWEGLPIALIEATAAGLPAIVTDVGGCREVVGAGPSGLIVPPDDVQAYSAAIRDLMDASDRRAVFSQNALRIARNYSIDRSAERHAEIYEEILAK